jgi:hypothetical protein
MESGVSLCEEYNWYAINGEQSLIMHAIVLKKRKLKRRENFIKHT